MKNIYLLQFVFSVLLFSANNSNAQTVSLFYDAEEVAVLKDTAATITLFTGKYCEGTTYLHWDVANQHADGFYIIYKSLDGEKYEALGYKEGIGVPISRPIAYYFKDENPSEGTTYYKVLHISMQQTYLITDNVTITRSSTLFSEKNNTKHETH